MKVCPGCGKECDDNSSFCAFCGFPIKDVNAFDEKSNETQPVESAQEPTEQTEKANTSENTSKDGFKNETISQPQQYNGNTQFNNPQPQYNNQQYSQQYRPNPQPSYNNYSNNNPELRNDPLAVAALVLGIVGVVFICCYGLGLIPGIIALILGAVSRKRINAQPNTYKGSGMATAGFAMGLIVTIIGALILILVIVAICFSAPFLSEFENEFMDGFQRGLKESSNYTGSGLISSIFQHLK